ncbi:MAG: polysaccharide biosynthesis C-terminal domain-containing protein [Phyllobacteriaceae bacterium]|nr:polysaccharide biosynthesis C-terminal domain-containing protein [Phyllobacteriaceae bacterium]
MTATASVGLIAVFAVDALNLFYISRLGVAELAAAVGFAGTLMFFTTSISIGLTIAVSALVARALGRGERKSAAAIAGAAMALTLIASSLVAMVTFPFLRPLLALLGATGVTLDLATSFMQIVHASSPVLAVGMAASGVLRGVGDARRAMYVTLGAAFAAALLDPLLIFVLDLRLTGAAVATVVSRLVLLAIGFHGVVRVHGLLARPDRSAFLARSRPFFAIAAPAILTQIATPVGNAWITRAIAVYGDEAVAGWAVIGRLVPVAFGALFALSGAVGPIIGQNAGAGLTGRLRETMTASLKFIMIYVAVVWAALALFAPQIAGLFGASGAAERLIVFFCVWAAGSFVFNGALFVANAAFNNLGFATLSTLFNWGRSTLGTIPFVWAGGMIAGAEGVLAGWGLGAVVFGVGAIVVALRKIDSVAGGPPDGKPAAPPTAHSPFTSGKGATAS